VYIKKSKGPLLIPFVWAWQEKAILFVVPRWSSGPAC